MSLQFDARPVFAGHQTFHPRFGWLKKSYDATTIDPAMFIREDAIVELGVGRNMVDSLRFWGQSFRIITNQSDIKTKSRSSSWYPTNLGFTLFDTDRGLDPFAENPATLWLLHWFGISRESFLPIWRIFFNEYSAIEFTTDEFAIFTEEQIAGTPWKSPVKTSIEKDIDCLIRMYCSRAARGRQTIDDLMDSPFRQLGLLTSSPAGPEVYRYVIGDKPFLSDLLITYCALDFLAINDPSSKTITTTRLSADSGSPGRILKITEYQIFSALEAVAHEIKGITVASPAGTSQLVLEDSTQEIAGRILLKIYNATKGDLKKFAVGIVGESARSINLNSVNKKVKAS